MQTLPLKSILFGEFLGTLVLILLGDGVVAAVQLQFQDAPANWIVITTGWALAVTLGVYVSGRLSGGHLNPAVTLALASRGEVAWAHVLPYCLAQFAGAFCGALLVYADYASAFSAFEAANQLVRGTMSEGKLLGPAAGGAGVFATYPAFDRIWGNVLSEFLGTCMLLVGVRAVTDRKNASPGMNLEPVLVGLVVWAIGLSLGGLTGYAINPARDFGPRLASMVLGWGPSVFQSHQSYFWIPLLVPVLGGVVGIWVYDVMIHGNLPSVEDPKADSSPSRPDVLD